MASVTATLPLFKHYNLLITLTCLVLFVYTMANLVASYAKPTQLNTQMVNKLLANQTFPLLFKLCLKPAYNNTIEQATYILFDPTCPSSSFSISLAYDLQYCQSPNIVRAQIIFIVSLTIDIYGVLGRR